MGGDDAGGGCGSREVTERTDAVKRSIVNSLRFLSDSLFALLLVRFR